MSFSKALEQALSLGDARNKKVDRNKPYISNTSLQIMKPDGRTVDYMLHKDTVFIINEAPEEYRDMLESLVKSNCVEAYDEIELQEEGLEPLPLEEGFEKVVTTKSLSEGIESSIYEEASTVKVPNMIDGKLAPEAVKKKKATKLERLKKKLEALKAKR